MADLVGAGNWTKFKNLIRTAHDTFFQDNVIWKRAQEIVSEFNEDTRIEHVDIPLKGLMSFNAFRSWPATKKSTAGEVDDMNTVLLLNKQYLNELGYINAAGYFDFNPSLDYFVHLGLLYKCEADTPVSQAHDEAQIFQLVLKRQETMTGNERYDG